MNSLQLHKLSLMTTDKNFSNEIQTLIRLLLSERNELAESLTKINEETIRVVARGRAWKV